jgi:hypothetical protein
MLGIAEGKLFAFLLMLWTIIPLLYYRNLGKKGSKLPELRIPSPVKVVDELVARAVEKDQPIHWTLGTTGLKYAFCTANNMAGVSLLGVLAKKSAEVDAHVIATVSQPDVYAVAYESVTSGNILAGNPDRSVDVRYLSPERLAYMASAVDLFQEENIAVNFMMGYFDFETLVLGEGTLEAGAIGWGGTVVTGQVPFLITTCDYVLIGPECYSAGAILSENDALKGSLIGQDISNYIILGFLLLGTILSTIGIDIIQNWLGL